MGVTSGFQPKSKKFNLKSTLCNALAKSESFLLNIWNKCAAFDCFHHIYLGYAENIWLFLYSKIMSVFVSADWVTYKSIVMAYFPVDCRYITDSNFLSKFLILVSKSNNRKKRNKSLPNDSREILSLRLEKKKKKIPMKYT